MRELINCMQTKIAQLPLDFGNRSESFFLELDLHFRLEFHPFFGRIKPVTVTVLHENYNEPAVYVVLVC